MTRPQWSGNIETWPMLFSRDHSILGAWYMHGGLRRDYEALFTDPEYAGHELIRLTSRSEVDRWLETVTPVDLA